VVVEIEGIPMPNTFSGYYFIVLGEKIEPSTVGDVYKRFRWIF
jgi:hypothetical protein